MKSQIIEDYFKENQTKFQNTIAYLKSKGFDSESVLRILHQNINYENLVRLDKKYSIPKEVWLNRVLKLIEK